MKKSLLLIGLTAALILISCDQSHPSGPPTEFRNFEIGPIIDLPVLLDACILQAEVCVQESSQCGTEWPSEEGQGWQSCISQYETCSYDVEEAHVSNCHVSYIWCRLELSKSAPQEYHDFCDTVADTCPVTNLQIP